MDTRLFLDQELISYRYSSSCCSSSCLRFGLLANTAHCKGFYLLPYIFSLPVTVNLSPKSLKLPCFKSDRDEIW